MKNLQICSYFATPPHQICCFLSCWNFCDRGILLQRTIVIILMFAKVLEVKLQRGVVAQSDVALPAVGDMLES